MGIDAPLYPVGLVVSGKKCLVVGGGPVAARKISSLIRCGAHVTVVAPELHVAAGILSAEGDLDNIGENPLDMQIRPYRAGEAADYQLVVTATGIKEVDSQVSADAQAGGVWVNSADDPDNCTFLLPSVHRDGPITVAVASGGSSPALATWLRKQIAQSIGPDLHRVAELLAEARRKLHDAGGSTESIDWQGLLDGGLADLIRRGDVAAARSKLDDAVSGVVGPSEPPGPTGPAGPPEPAGPPGRQ